MKIRKTSEFIHLITMILSIFISISSCSSSSHSNSHSHSTSMSISSLASTLPIIHIKDNIDELTYFDLTSITTNTVYKINNDQALVYENNQWIDFQTTTIYTMINTFDLALTLSIIFYYEKLTHSWEFSKVLTLRDIYYCSVAPGEIGQIWIDLQYHEFKSIKYRILENFPKFTIHNREESNNNKVISSKNRKKKFLLKKKLKFGKWKEISKMFLLNGKKLPIISCITTNDNKDKQLDCEGKSLLKLKEFKMF